MNRSDDEQTPVLAEIDRTLLALSDARDVLKLDAAIGVMRDQRDKIKSELRNFLHEKNKRSLKDSQVEVSFVDTHEPMCTCHGVHLRECANARKGEPVQVTLTQCEPYLKVRAVKA